MKKMPSYKIKLSENSMDIRCPQGLTQAQQDEFWIRHAKSLAEQAEVSGEVPVGAVVVLDNQMIGEGFNQPIQNNDPTAHAEMIALQQAGQTVGNYRLIDATLYVTLEPCPMCAGAMVHARVKRLVYGASDLKTGAAGSLFNLVNNAQLNHQVSVTSGVLQQACSEQLSGFFKKRREYKKQLRQAKTK